MEKHFKIVDSFLFSEPHEKELLLLKFILENDGIDEWILVENAYSFQGEYKGLHAERIVQSDSRFSPFLHKLTIISAEKQHPILEKTQEAEKNAFKAEYWQRNLAYAYFMEKYDTNDWIFISDTDEMIDFSNRSRSDELLNKMQNAAHGLLIVPTKKFWFDFDNAYIPILGNPVCTKQYMLDNNKQLHEVRIENRRIIKNTWNVIAAFEYSSCFSETYMIRKLDTFSHTGFTAKELKQSLRCNHRPTIESSTWKLKNDPYFFFETIALSGGNSPEYVRLNLAALKTHAVNPLYKQNRRTDYPHLFTVNYQLNAWYGKMLTLIRRKTRYLKHKLGLN